MTNDDTLYKYKDRYVKYDELMTLVFEYLSEHPFQDHTFIADKLGSRPGIIKNVIEDGIIKITKRYKENNGVDVSFSYLCKTTGVKMIYIESLIEQDRIVLHKLTPQEYNEMREREKEAKKNQQLDYLRQISDSLPSSESSQVTPSKNPNKYRSYIPTRYDKRY